MHTPERDDLVGRTLDGFRVESVLGSGGMGRVYKAFDTGLHRTVAIKIIAPFLLSPEFELRFQREARALSAVNHPNVAQVYSFGRHDGRPYYAMEYIDGHSLADVADRGGHLAGLRSLRYLVEAATGLQAAFAKGIIHRDIKPSNMMIDKSDHLKIVDFGLARRAEGDLSLTPAATAIGTPRYMSPEQAIGQRADHRSDIYSLGCSFYHLFAGAPPFDADDGVAILLQHINSPLPPLASRNRRVPQAVSSIIEKMMAKRPEDRYQTYEELIADLGRAQSGAAAPLPPPRAAATVRTSPALALPGGIQPWMLILGGAIVLVVAAGIISGKRHPPGGTASAAKPSTAAGAEAKPSGTDEPAAPVVQLPTGQIDPAMLIGRALSAKTLANMKKISMAAEVWKAQQETLPPSLDPIAERYELHPQELVDAWKTAIRYETDGFMKYTLTSAGADRTFGTADDVVLENGFFTRGEPDMSVPEITR